MTAPEGGRGWLTVAALAVTTALLAVISPALLIFIPLALLLIALPPRRPVMLALAGFIMWLAFTTTPDVNPLWYFERGWALLLGAWFIMMVALVPAWGFLPRALAALVGTAVSAGILLVVKGNVLSQLDAVVTEKLRAGAAEAVTMWSRAVGLDRVSSQVTQAVYKAAELQAELYPALLGLASLAALGVTWWAFGRIARGEPRPLRPLREFRFRDELVWLFIAGLVLILLPLGNELVTRAGGNLLTFMAVLYALRGVAVLVVIGGVPGPLGLVLGALLVVFLYPIVMATTFLVGLSDTWLDIRARRQASSHPGS